MKTIENVREILMRAPNARLEEVAEQLETSARSIQRMILRCGATFRRLAADARLQRAKEILATSDDKIEVVARQAGFSGAATMSRAFAAQGLISPRSYRRSVRPGRPYPDST